MKKTLSLPNPLVTEAGEPVASVSAWGDMRRPEILELFSGHVYGRAPGKPAGMQFEHVDEARDALEGRAIRKQVAIHIISETKQILLDLLIYLPKEMHRPVPLFLLLNFHGNHTIHPDPAILLPKGYVAETYSPPERFRGAHRSRFPVELILDRGYGLATAYCGDIDPDFDDGFENGVHPLFDPPGGRPDDAWATVAAWAWGLGRLMDYLQTDDEIDQTRISVLGHSRLGKAALWAGAQDERFALVISNNSGCTGAALARRRQGETIKAINDRFPHWFCHAYKRYDDREEALPVDQHMLIGLMAPRPVYVASATEDDWAVPRGEFLACVHAEPVYELYGLDGLGSSTMLPPERPLHGGRIGYHLRTGAHDLTAYDWRCYLDFADRQWAQKAG